MKLKDIGEFELIERMARVFHRDPSGFCGGGALTGLKTGIGDDAAVWIGPRSGYTIATTDAMVEGVHFTPRTAGWYDLGWKAMASNISDIAGMGGTPLYALAVLGAPPDLDVASVVQLCEGMADVAWEFGAAVVGGDTVSSPVTMISITLIGETAPGGHANGNPRTLSRFAARPDDVLAVTGSLGSSAGGLELLLTGREEVSEAAAPLVDAHRRPMPRVKEGQLLVEAGIRCGMDLSDGLAGDLLRICQASGVAANVEIDKLPIDPALRQLFGARAIDLALSGGEDYELLCSGPSEIVRRAQQMLDVVGTRLTVVGAVVDATEGRPPVLLADSDGKLFPPPRSGWEHFAAGRHAAGS